MASATLIGGNLWLVTRDDGKTERVATKATDNNVAAAIAIATAVETAPDAATMLAQWRTGATCSNFQFRVALANINKLVLANATVAASGNVLVQLALAYAPELRRNSPAIATLAASMGLTATDLDNLFIAADIIAP